MPASYWNDGQPAQGATAAFFGAFFPTARAALRQRWPAVWALVQPGWLAARCPEQQVVLHLPWGGPDAPQGLTLRNPGLLPWQLAGVGVALWGLRRLAGPAHAYLRHSLLYFCLMNLR